MSADTMMKELRAVVFGKLGFSFKKNGAFKQFSALVTHQVPRGKNDTHYFNTDKHFTSVQMMIDKLMGEIRLPVLEEQNLESRKNLGIALFLPFRIVRFWLE